MVSGSNSYSDSQSHTGSASRKSINGNNMPKGHTGLKNDKPSHGGTSHERNAQNNGKYTNERNTGYKAQNDKHDGNKAQNDKPDGYKKAQNNGNNGSKAQNDLNASHRGLEQSRKRKGDDKPQTVTKKPHNYETEDGEIPSNNISAISDASFNDINMSADLNGLHQNSSMLQISKAAEPNSSKNVKPQGSDNNSPKRLPAIYLRINSHVVSQYQCPVARANEVIKCATEMAKAIDPDAKICIKFTKLILADNNAQIMIATDDKISHDILLNCPWPPGAFKKGVQILRKYSTKERRQIWAILKRVDKVYDLSDAQIEAQLDKQGITKAQRLIGKLSNEPTGTIKITFVNKDKYEAAKKEGVYIGYSRFKIETNSVIQCFKCQQFGHTKINCPNSLKCMLCSGDHESTDCPNRAKEQLKCANCSGNHASCARACPSLKLAYKEAKSYAEMVKTTKKAQTEPLTVKKTDSNIKTHKLEDELAKLKNLCSLLIDLLKTTKNVDQKALQAILDQNPLSDLLPPSETDADLNKTEKTNKSKNVKTQQKIQ